MIKKIKIEFEISGTKITIPFKAICSVTDKKFLGDVIVEYRPHKEVIEYVSLEDFIKQVTKSKQTVEELANLVYEEVRKTINPLYLKVTVNVKKSLAHQPVYVWKESEKD